MFLSNSVVHAAWKESQGKLTEMRLKRKWKIDSQMGAIRAKKLNKQDIHNCKAVTSKHTRKIKIAKKYGATAVVD